MTLTKVHSRMIAGAPANVQDFGAVGDGITDDTVAIQAAIDSSVAVFFPNSNYINFKSNSPKPIPIWRYQSRK